MAYKVRYTPQALGDLHFIFKDVAEHNPRAASAVKSRIRKRIESLALFPMSGPETATPGFEDARRRPLSVPHLLRNRRSGEASRYRSHSSCLSRQIAPKINKLAAIPRPFEDILREHLGK
jgi:plasmid stabilization system protein ParE